jgi:hypothetical protein
LRAAARSRAVNALFGSAKESGLFEREYAISLTYPGWDPQKHQQGQYA